ncbi:hypothetical protein JHK82_012526 [Glycine max]|nr:hypothetical protein JHK82_012526 [Glycine max]
MEGCSVRVEVVCDALHEHQVLLGFDLAALASDLDFRGTSEADAPRKRLAKPLIFCQTESDCPMENGYAQPVEGIHVLVDMQNTMGCDCLGYIKYFDAYFKNFTGGGETIENYVCLHEKDHEMLWKHQDWRTGLAEVHTKRRNHLHQKKMNDLVYVMYNLKLKSGQIRKLVLELPFEDMESSDEWITGNGDDIFYEDNVQVEQPLGESGSGNNIDLIGESLSDTTLDAFDIDNLVLNDNVEDHFSTKEELEDDGGGGDIGDDLIRGLINI